MIAETTSSSAHGVSLAPFRALRPDVGNERLGRLLCPPYDVIDSATRTRLLAADPDNAVAVVLPDPTPDGYAAAGARLESWIRTELWALDNQPALFVYDLRPEGGRPTRGLVGAVELRDPADGVILPHEDTMAGPVADRLQVMTSTGADLEPIYLVYDGGGAASDLVRSVGGRDPVAATTTPDGVQHTLWAVTDPAELKAVDADLRSRRALIADGHHRYATYRERQRLRRLDAGPGPWDRGLAFIVDTEDYGPTVEAIQRVVRGLPLDTAIGALPAGSVREQERDPMTALMQLEEISGFAAVLTDGRRTVVVTDPDRHLRDRARAATSEAVGDLDVTVLHHALVRSVWQLEDDVDTVAYAHSAAEAIDEATAPGRHEPSFAVLLRPTPVAAVAAVAGAGERMPRKSTLFTPKPASGLLIRRLADQPEGS